MTEYASLDELTTSLVDTASGLPEDDVTLPSGRKIRVRGLSRTELLRTKEIGDRAEYEAFFLSTAMVIPAMTIEAVRTWQSISLPPEIEPITDKIAELSGMDEGAERRAVKELTEEQGAEFRDVPGGGAQDDARPTEADAAG